MILSFVCDLGWHLKPTLASPMKSSTAAESLGTHCSLLIITAYCLIYLHSLGLQQMSCFAFKIADLIYQKGENIV